jgi:hypothetical protein
MTTNVKFKYDELSLDSTSICNMSFELIEVVHPVSPVEFEKVCADKFGLAEPVIVSPLVGIPVLFQISITVVVDVFEIKYHSDIVPEYGTIILVEFLGPVDIGTEFPTTKFK